MHACKICDFTGMYYTIHHYLLNNNTIQENESNLHVLLWREITLHASVNLAFNLTIFTFCFSILSSRCWFVLIINFFDFLYWFFLALNSFHLRIQSSNSSLNVLFSSSNNTVLDRQCLSLPFKSVILSWYALSSTCYRVSSSLVTWGEIGLSIYWLDDGSGSAIPVSTPGWVTLALLDFTSLPCTKVGLFTLIVSGIDDGMSSSILTTAG